jgi:hypothetical protein
MSARPADDQLELGTCGARARHPSYGTRTCTLPAGHQPPPGQPPTSTDGWHESTDHIRWATPQALANRTAALTSATQAA